MVYEQEVWHPTISVLPEVMCKGPALARAEEMTRHVIMQNIKKTSQGAPSWMRSALRWLCDVPSDEHLRACCRDAQTLSSQCLASNGPSLQCRSRIASATEAASLCCRSSMIL